ncbi:MAG TPA: hypothetical protein PLD20_31470 [Blastocatellia bacterium]|nr:hypothetical protein [Blastocatellia bacterium]HMZ22493.1 hypothetical protein [Blastocatellia bacterium]
MRLLNFGLLLLVLCSAIVNVQSSEPTDSPPASENKSADSGKTIPWQEYKDALKEERELLEKQAEKHYTALEKLYDTAIKIFGGILLATLLVGGFFFGKTLAEVKNFARGQTEAILRSQLEAEVRKELNAALKARKVLWVFSGDDVTATHEITYLKQVGLEDVAPITDLAQFSPAQAGLVIFSYDKSQSGKNKLKTIVEQLHPPLFLIIYTYNPNGTEVRLEDAERGILKGFDRYVPANFPATLVGHAKTLVLRGRDM